MKNIAIFLLCAACLTMTACGKTADSTTEEITTITEAMDAEFTDISESTAAMSLPIEDIAHAFAEQVFTALQNNKTADDPIPYAPISTAHEIQSFDPEAMEAELRLLDIDFDGVPELFTTSHGTMGTGGHSIYTADGQFYGYGLYTICFSDFMTDGKAVYAPSGSNSTFGYTKLAVGLPYVSTNGGGFFNGLETPVNICTDGNKVETTISSEEEYQKLIEDSFDISYDSLQPIDLEYNRYISGYLRVPDSENYTEEDIYNCLLTLLQEYEEKASSETSSNTADNALLSAKLSELDGTLLASFNYGNGEDDILAAIAYGTAPSVDIWRFTDNTEESVMPFCGMLSDVYGIHSESGVNSLVICNYAQGLANPATILSVIDGDVVVFSEYKSDTNSADLLWYCNKNGADLICRKGNGVSMGSYNIIPYYLDVSDNKYKPYGLTEISIDEARELDKNNVIPDADRAISAYRHDNGLIHINYDDVTEAAFGDEHIASRTFVAENGCLRAYEDGDIKYGFFLQSLSVTE